MEELLGGAINFESIGIVTILGYLAFDYRKKWARAQKEIRGLLREVADMKPEHENGDLE